MRRQPRRSGPGAGGERLERWVEAWIGRRLGASWRSSGPRAAGAGRGRAAASPSAWSSSWARCAARRPTALVRDLGEADRRALTRLGVRFGLLHHLRARSAQAGRQRGARAAFARLPRPRRSTLPPPGRTVLRPHAAGAGQDMVAIGFAGFDGFALRVDILERWPRGSARQARGSRPPSWCPPALAAEAGLTREELGVLVGALGFPCRRRRGRCHGCLQPRRPAAGTRRGKPVRGRPASARRTRRSRCWPGSRRRLERHAPRCGWTSGCGMRGSSGTATWPRIWSPARRVRLNDQIVAKTHQLVRPGDVITLTEPAQVRVLRVLALGERRGPASEARCSTRRSRG